ncbi:fasciclin domain-containing protein [Rhodobacterales bacterium HKCCE4037]|nr:fasciclin domain-containing protein [Rhodobacterales bacterium HKCCE4037]
MMRKSLIALATTTALAAPLALNAQTIPEVAAEAGSFTTLLAAVEAAGLAETLSGEGPFTVFAPTDEAFAALPEGTVEGLLEDTDALTAILTYHVVPGAVMSGDLSDGMTAETVNGAEVTITIGDNVMVNDATVVTPDIEASNGVIHVIDSVIMPPM